MRSTLVLERRLRRTKRTRAPPPLLSRLHSRSCRSSSGRAGAEVVLSPLHRPPPFAKLSFALRLRQLGTEGSADLPGAADLLLIAPEADPQSSQKGCSERRGLEIFRSDDIRAKQIRLKLHQQVVRRGPPVHLECRDRLTGVCRHCRSQIMNLKCNSLEERPGQMRGGGGAIDPGDEAAGFGPPMRCSQAHQGWHEDDLSCIGDL